MKVYEITQISFQSYTFLDLNIKDYGPLNLIQLVALLKRVTDRTFVFSGTQVLYYMWIPSFPDNLA